MPKRLREPTGSLRVHNRSVRLLVFGGVLSLSACNLPPWASQKSEATDQPAAAAAGPEGAAKAPTRPEWASALYGRSAKDVFPETGDCIGNLDGATRKGELLTLFGWAWDPASAVPANRIVMVDGAGVIVAAGEGGSLREDVPRARPDVTSRTTGWIVRAQNLSGPLTAYAVVGGRALCRLGYLKQ